MSEAQSESPYIFREEKMLKISKLFSIAATAFIVSGQALFAGNIPESDDPIKVTIQDWTGQHFSTHVAAGLLKEMGYNVEIVVSDAITQHPAIASGNINLSTEVWTNNVGDLYDGLVEKGDIVVVGELGLSPKEGWIYPPYMDERCPGLPDYKALYECAQAFGSAETFPKGRLITYPASWGTRSRDIIASIEMPFEPIPGGSEGAMVAELKSALAAEEPVIMMFWQPHWIFAAYDFNWVEWNPIEGKCVEESQEKETACGFEQAKVQKIVSKGFEDKWPAAFKMFKAMQLTNADENAAILEVDEKGRKVEEVAAEWISENKNIWQNWMN